MSGIKVYTPYSKDGSDSETMVINTRGKNMNFKVHETTCQTARDCMKRRLLKHELSLNSQK